MLYFKFGQDRLAETNALKAFELGQRAIEIPFEARFVTEQVMELWSDRNVLPKRFQLHSLDSIEARALMLVVFVASLQVLLHYKMRCH